jgi:hypothetical protein
MDVKDLIKPPFANYDVVVYFGCGLFCLPLAFHYVVEPSGLRFPRFQFNLGIDFANIAISTLSLLFAVYIMGHMIAYAASYTIEKSVDLAFGKISSAIIISNITSPSKTPETIQAWVGRRLIAAFEKKRRFWTLVRATILLPVAPSLIFGFATQSFDYFRNRVPKRVFDQIKKECARRGYGPVGLHTKWYKSVEHDVINNNESAVARMYNYLVISGIFRSLSFIFLCCAWAEVYYWMHMTWDSHDIIKTIMSDKQLNHSHVTMLLIYNGLFSFSLSAYIKFTRRYAEEALFAFVLKR